MHDPLIFDRPFFLQVLLFLISTKESLLDDCSQHGIMESIKIISTISPNISRMICDKTYASQLRNSLLGSCKKSLSFYNLDPMIVIRCQSYIFWIWLSWNSMLLWHPFSWKVRTFIRYHPRFFLCKHLCTGFTEVLNNFGSSDGMF